MSFHQKHKCCKKIDAKQMADKAWTLKERVRVAEQKRSEWEKGWSELDAYNKKLRRMLIEAKAKPFLCDNLRLLDLVRYSRESLVKAGLITTEEYAVLMTQVPSCSPVRLEGYDAMKACAEKAEQKLSELKEQVVEVLKSATNMVHVWFRQSGHVFESMGSDNPRAQAIDEAASELRRSSRAAELLERIKT